jgi:DNA-binding MarR family transcriptional regulator
MMTDKHAKSKPQASEGRFAYGGLQRTIHEKARLGIMTSLATHPSGALFNDLKAWCALTDGNLNRHLQVLCDAGLVEVWKGGEGGRRSQTLYRLTRQGKAELLEYLAVLESVIADAAAVRESTEAATRRKSDSSPGWSPA